LLILKQDNPALLVTVTALIGALVAGLAALSGSFVRRR
jgi:LPS O-antigen subunit length determinant protein (WzzB/FepE family)